MSSIQSGRTELNRSPKDPTVFIETDDGIERYTDIADIAEVAEGRLMIASLDGGKEIVGGVIFGAFGSWKMWVEGLTGGVEQYSPKTPMKMPTGNIRFHSEHGRRERAGRIKRLKRIDL
jgi:hypothetical protein